MTRTRWTGTSQPKRSRQVLVNTGIFGTASAETSVKPSRNNRSQWMLLMADDFAM